MYEDDVYRIRCTIMRGGTSKGVFIPRNELPEDPAARDRMILAIFGSPDVRQIDGLGGADTLTSKLAIIGPPTRPDADVDYLFAQVGVDRAVVDYKGNCGNISSAVGPYAIDESLVEAHGPTTTVRIHQVNTRSIIVAEVPVKDRRAAVDGDFRIAGVPGTGAKVTLDFRDSAGAVTGRLLPTGRPRDTVTLNDGTSLEVSIVDAANPLVFVRASDLGLSGTEAPGVIDGDSGLLERIEEIRSAACEMIGLVGDRRLATKDSPYVPFIVLAGPPAAYADFTTGRPISQGDVDIVCRLLFMQKMHKTYPGSGAVCTGAAARIPGTIVYEFLSSDARARRELRIGHPAGVIEVESEVRVSEGGITLTRAAIYRTARRIMDGYVYVLRSRVDS